MYAHGSEERLLQAARRDSVIRNVEKKHFLGDFLLEAKAIHFWNP